MSDRKLLPKPGFEFDVSDEAGVNCISIATFVLIKLHINPVIQTLHMQIAASQRFVSHHEAAATSFDMSGDRPRFKGQPAKGLRPPRVKQSQGRKTEMSPSGLT